MTPLKKRMIACLQGKNLPGSIKKQYVEEVAALARHFNQSPDHIEPAQVRGYLVECARQMIADKLAAFEFFYAETLGWVWDNRMMMPRPPIPWSPECPIRRRMNEDMRLRNLAHKTRTEYDRWVGKFAEFHSASPDSLGMDEVRDYLVHLMDVEEKSVSSFGVASAALRFLYAKSLRREKRLGPGLYSAAQTREDPARHPQSKRGRSFHRGGPRGQRPGYRDGTLRGGPPYQRGRPPESHRHR
jgi:integrase-like protein